MFSCRLFYRNRLLQVVMMDKIIVWADRVITALTVIAYVLVLIIYLHEGLVPFIKAVAIPGVSFILVSVFRYIYNAKRPYEVMDVVPLSGKKTNGKSMPSRHTFSIFIIAMTVLYFDFRLGICLMIAGVILAALRVIERVHFVRDVVVGALLGILLGSLYFILPF